MASSTLATHLFIAFAVICFAAGPTSATSFIVRNNCGRTLNIIVQENPGPSIGVSNFGLGAGGSQPLNPPNGWGGNIGTGTPGLLAEFTINSNAGNDFYDISAVNGFFRDTGMSITGSGRNLLCRPNNCPPQNTNGNVCTSPNRDDPNSQYAQNVRASCPDAYSWSGDPMKTVGTGTGGTFTITFCG